MSVILPYLINAALNFVLGLLVAYFLGPDEFGRYAIGAALMVLINAACLDWLKLAAIRFYSEETRLNEPEIRATLDALVAGIALALSGLVVAAAVAGLDFGIPVMLLATAVAAGICSGLFDYHGAIARARYLDSAYARLILIKNVLALLLMVGGAWVTKSATMVMLGSCLSVAAALVTVRRTLADAPLSFRAANRDRMGEFARYALPLVGANVLYASIPLLNRSLLAGGLGFAESGYFSLASDMGIKLFGTLNSTLELVLLQQVVQIDAAEGRPAAERRMADNLVIVVMILAPLALGMWLILPAFEALVVPSSYRGPFQSYFVALLPSFVALGLFQAGLNPALLVSKRTAPAIVAAGVAVAVNLVFLALVAVSSGGIAYGWAQSAGFLAALGVTAAVVWRMVAARPRWRDFGLIGLGLALMAGVLLPLRGTLSPWLELPLMGALGAAVYAAVMWGANVAGCRNVAQALRSLRGPAGAIERS